MVKSSKPKQNTTPEPTGIPLTGAKADKRLLDALKDDVAPEATPALQFMLDNAKTISSIVVGIVLISIIVIGYQWNSQKNLEKAQTDIAAVLLNGGKAEEIVSGLEAFIPEVPSELQVSIYSEIVFRLEQLENYPQAAEYWEKIYNKTSDSAFKTVAGLGWAKNLVAQDKLKEASSVLDNLAKQANEAILPQVEIEQAFIAEKLGDLNKSLKIYQSLLTKESQFSNAFISAQIEQINNALAKTAPTE